MIPGGERDDGRAGRFLRTALFPLILIVLLVYLASQTLLDSDRGADKQVYSNLKALIREEPARIESATFKPRTQVVELAMRDGETLEANYPSDNSAYALEQLLDAARVRHDSKGSGESAWWSFLTYLLPFILFFGFWIFLMQRTRQTRPDEVP